MEDTLINFYDNKEYDKIKTNVENISEDDITSMLERTNHSRSHDLTKLISSLFIGLQGPRMKQRGERRKMVVFTKMLDVVTFQNLQSKLLIDILNVLTRELDGLSGECCVQLMEDLLLIINNTQASSYKGLDLLPKLFSVLEGQNLVLRGARMHGNEYKQKTIDNICNSRWCPQCLLNMASVIRELQLSSEELNNIMITFVKYFRLAHVQDIPAIVHQLLLIASKGCRSLIVVAIVEMFCGDKEYKDDGSAEENEISSGARQGLEQVESTCLYHVVVAVGQHEGLAREVLKYLKLCQLGSRALISSPFLISLSLSLAKINDSQKQVLKMLKEAVVSGVQRRELWWLSGCDVTPSTHCFMTAVRKSLRSWDSVMEGLIAFCFHLLDSTKCPGKPSFNSPTNKNSPLINTLTSLADEILEECAKVHVNVAMAIVNQLINKVVVKAANVKPFTDILHRIIRTCGHFILTTNNNNNLTTSLFRNTFDYFRHLPCTTSAPLLSCIMPVLRTNHPLRNTLIITLRKALFAREAETRKMGIHGFLMLLGNTKVLAGTMPSSQSQRLYSSQVMVDVHNVHSDNDDNSALCMEVLGVLKRCFDQDAQVKSIFYRGLVEVSEKNEFLMEPIMQLLYNHLMTFYSGDGPTQPPLKFKQCISGMEASDVSVMEPLAELLNSLLDIIQKYKESKNGGDDDDDGGDGDSNLLSSIEDDNERSGNGNNPSGGDDDDADNMKVLMQRVDVVVDSVASRLINLDVEDLQFEKGADWESGSRNHHLFTTTASTITVLMQREFMKKRLRNIERGMKLFKTLQDITHHVTEHHTGKKTNRAGHSDTQATPHLYHLQFLTFVVTSVLSSYLEDENSTTKDNNNTTTNNNIASIISTNASFIPYIFNIVISTLQHTTTHTTTTTHSSVDCCCGGSFDGVCGTYAHLTRCSFHPCSPHALIQTCIAPLEYA